MRGRQYVTKFISKVLYNIVWKEMIVNNSVSYEKVFKVRWAIHYSIAPVGWAAVSDII